MTDNIMELIGQRRHKLIIKSYHDAQAECICGHWYYCRTGEATEEEIEMEYNKHLK